MKTLVSLIFLMTCSTFYCKAAEPKSAAEIAKGAFPAFVSIATFDRFKNPIAIGSGFFSAKDVIVTNNHVINGAAYVIARLSEKNRTFNVTKILMANKEKDLAMLQVDKENPDILSFGDSEKLEVGEKIYALGNPEGLEGTFSDGIISSLRRQYGLLQITAPISPGSSGGPVFNAKGEVIGVAVAYLKDGQNLNFAVPINDLKTLISMPPSNYKPQKMLVQSTQTEEALQPIQIGTDLVVTDHWFFIGFIGNQNKASYLKTTSKIVKLNQSFGIRTVFNTTKEKLKYKVELHVPNSPENFPCSKCGNGSVIVSKEKNLVTVDGEVPGSKGSVAFYWGVAKGDPIGRYEMKMSLEGTPIETYTFTVSDEVTNTPEALERRPSQVEKGENSPAVKDVGLCFTNQGNINSANDYLLALTDTLVEVKTGTNSVQNAGKGSKALDPSDLMVSYGESVQHLGCGIKHIKNYQKSKNENIVLSSEGMEKALTDLIDLEKTDTAYLKAALNGDTDTRPGTRAEYTSQQKLAYDKAYQVMLASVSAATFATLPIEKEKKLTKINLTKKQRDQIVSKLKKNFTSNVKKNGGTYVEAAAYELEKFLQDNWKFADTK